jgi:hypothetical protein
LHCNTILAARRKTDTRPHKHFEISWLRFFVDFFRKRNEEKMLVLLDWEVKTKIAQKLGPFLGQVLWQ